MNVIVWLEMEVAYLDIVVKYVIQYATGTLLRWNRSDIHIPTAKQ